MTATNNYVSELLPLAAGTSAQPGNHARPRRHETIHHTHAPPLGRARRNFGNQAERLAADIPGAVGVRYLDRSAHLPMLEQPEEYASMAMACLA